MYDPCLDGVIIHPPAGWNIYLCYLLAFRNFLLFPEHVKYLGIFVFKDVFKRL